MSTDLVETSWMGGKPPYGYRVEGRRRTARLMLADIPDPATGYSEVDVLRLMRRLVVEEGWTLEQVGLHLTTLGIPTREGSIWQHSAVYRSLCNPTLAGTRVYRGPDGTLHSHPVPAIFTESEMVELRATLRDHRTRSGVPHEEDIWLLRGMLRCANCGGIYGPGYGTFQRGEDGERGERFRYYACPTRHHAAAFNRRRKMRGIPPAICDGAHIRADKIEAKVWADVETYLREPGTVLRAIAARRADDATQSEQHRSVLAHVQSDLNSLQGERDAILTQFRKGRITEQDLDRQLAFIEAEQAQHIQRRETALAALADAQTMDDRLEAAKDLLQRLHAWTIPRH